MDDIILGSGRRRTAYLTDDLDSVEKRAHVLKQGKEANTREWFLWHWVKSTVLEPFFVPVTRISSDAESLWQQRVDPLETSPWAQTLHADLDLMVTQMGPYLNTKLRNKRGRVELHVWGINRTTLHCQLFDYEHLDRDQLAQSLRDVSIENIARIHPELWSKHN